MVRGLTIFQAWFQDFENQYVLIGGTAASITMTERVRQGEVIDSKKINKHLTDIVQLSALLQPGQSIDLPEQLKADLQTFVQAIFALNRPECLQPMRRIADAYALKM